MQNLSTTLSQFFLAACRIRARKIFLQFLHNYFLTAVRKQRFYKDFWEEL
jgi:hypothetical protein